MAKSRLLPRIVIALAAALFVRHFCQPAFTALVVPNFRPAQPRCAATQMKAGKCPFTSMFAGGDTLQAEAPFTTHDGSPKQDWWPNSLDLSMLKAADGDNSPASLKNFNYAEEFKTLDLDAVKKDIMELMTHSQEWWPADYGHYGPFFVRMAWHSAGTYRTFDGRGGGGKGSLRFAPLNSWPDNANLDKAKRLLWPIKQKYGKRLSWADLMIFTGNCAMESMGLPQFGFGGGREDIWEPEDINWGPEMEWLADGRHQNGQTGESLENPLGAVQMGLIYVNPEGPGGDPDAMAAAQDMRTTFGRMAMNDEETVALVAGGHTFGKAHGAAPPGDHVGPEPEGASMENMGFGWMSNFNSGKGVDAITSGLEGAWTQNPTQWDNGYFENLFNYAWQKTKSPAGATQWTPDDASTKDMVPDAHDPSKKHAPMMFTTDLALKADPSYAAISKRFHENPKEFETAFTKAWYKLTHRDMGPHSRLLGKYVPEPQIWQDPVPAATHSPIGEKEADELKGKVLQSGLSTGQLVRTAWASASTYRVTDHRGGANGARVRLSPQKDWEVNDPDELAQVLQTLEGVQAAFNAQHSSTPVSLADLIVLAGGAAIEEAAKKGGHAVKVPFTPGRTDATDEQTDAASFDVLEPTADGFRNHVSLGHKRSASIETLLVDRAQMLTLSAPEMTALVGGLRVLDANTRQSQVGVLTKTPGTLNNDYFVNLLDMNHNWKVSDKNSNLYEARHFKTGEVVWTGSRADLVFGSNSELRALAEYYGCDDSKQAFVNDFVAAWAKVMNVDRFDVAK
jgi:catalase-peroxidase